MDFGDATTVTALNADVVNYSRLMSDDREATSAAMAVARASVDTAIAAHDGHLVNFVGDNFMAVFGRATDAVSAAIDICSALEEENTSLPSGRWLRFRMGAERGEVSVTDGHFEGDVLNVAARIQALATPGGLSVSGGVYVELDEPALRFRPRGSRRLKNIPAPVEVYDFVDLPTNRPREMASQLALEIPTLAVLPLHTEGVDPGVARTGSVVRADMIHRLAGIPELDVLDASEGDLASPPDVRARYMLESGVHQVGERLRLYATLYDVTTMNVVKAHKASGTVGDLLDMSETLANQMGHTVEVELVVGVPAGLYDELGDAESIQKVYMGWYYLRSFTEQGWHQALRLFGEVAESHPHLTYGWVLSAFANWMGASNGWSQDAAETMQLARSQARRGADIGDPTGMAQAVEAAVLMSTGHIDEAVQALEGLEITRPTCDVTYGLEGSVKRYLGKWEEAVELMNTAMRLTGINKPWYPTVKACSLLIGHKPETAVAVAESVVEYQPNNVEALLVLAASQVELGLRRRAETTADAIRERFPGLDVDAWLAAQPYQDPRLLERWRTGLSQLDLTAAS